MKNFKVITPSFLKFTKHFLLFCSGVTLPVVLSENVHGSEITKYITIGTIALGTAIIASFSGGYAIYSIFKSLKSARVWAIVIGIFWGVFHLMLDRLMVSTIRHKKKDSHELLHKESSTETNEPQQHPESYTQQPFFRILIQTIPRLIMAGLMGFIVSKPLEVFIFQDQIILSKVAQEAEAVRDEIDEIQGNIQEKEKNRDTLYSEAEELRRNWELQAAEGPQLRADTIHDEIELSREEELEPKKDELERLEAVENNFEKISVSTQPQDSNSAGTQPQDLNIEDLIKGYRNLGIFTQYKLMANNSDLRTASWLITGLFILIEILPTFAKLLSGSDSYDEALDNESNVKIYESKQRAMYNRHVVDKAIYHEKSAEKVRLDKELELLATSLETDQTNQSRLLVFLKDQFESILQDLPHVEPYRNVRTQTKQSLSQQIGAKFSDYSKFVSENQQSSHQKTRNAKTSRKPVSKDNLNDEETLRQSPLKESLNSSTSYSNRKKPSLDFGGHGIDKTHQESKEHSPKTQRPSSVPQSSEYGSISYEEEENNGSIPYEEENNGSISHEEL